MLQTEAGGQYLFDEYLQFYLAGEDVIVKNVKGIEPRAFIHVPLLDAHPLLQLLVF